MIREQWLAFRRTCAGRNLREYAIWLDEELTWRILLLRDANEPDKGPEHTAPLVLEAADLSETGHVGVGLGLRTDTGPLLRLEPATVACSEPDHAAGGLLARYLGWCLHRGLFRGHISWLAAEQRGRWPVLGAAVYALARLAATVLIRAAVLDAALRGNALPEPQTIGSRAMAHAIMYADQEFYALPFLGALL